MGLISRAEESSPFNVVPMTPGRPIALEDKVAVVEKEEEQAEEEEEEDDDDALWDKTRPL